jgi:hypothetical protein
MTTHLAFPSHSVALTAADRNRDKSMQDPTHAQDYHVDTMHACMHTCLANP